MYRRRTGQLGNQECREKIASLKVSMGFTPEDFTDLGSRLTAVLRGEMRKTGRSVSFSHKLSIHLELVCGMFTEKLRAKERKLREGRAGSNDDQDN